MVILWKLEAKSSIRDTMSTSRLTQSFSNLAKNIDGRFNVTSRWEALRKYAQDKPMRALFLGSVFTMVIVPVLMFLFVIGSSLAVGVSALLCIQGAVLTTAVVVLFPVLACCVVCAAGFTAFIFVSKQALAVAVWMWDKVYGTIGTPVTNMVVLGASKFNIRGKITMPPMPPMPSVNCKVSGNSTNNSNVLESEGQGDYPRFRAHWQYPDNEQEYNDIEQEYNSAEQDSENEG